jgi:hypothetical protein
VGHVITSVLALAAIGGERALEEVVALGLHALGGQLRLRLRLPRAGAGAFAFVRLPFVVKSSISTLRVEGLAQQCLPLPLDRGVKSFLASW